MRKTLIFLLILLWLCSGRSNALVNYEAAPLEVKGVLLLQDAANPGAYYYLPKAPRVALGPDGRPAFSMVKFVDPDGKTSGGLLHMLVTLTLPSDELEALRQAFRKVRPGAEIVGPVPLLQEKEGSFQVVSGTLSDKGFTRTLISSGRAPLTPGSQAAIAAVLDQHGATLLWDSLKSPTSDVSVSIRAYYEAVLPSITAHVSADISTVYEHFSKVKNVQEEYTRDQIRQITDELVRTGVIKVEVTERLPGEAGNKAIQGLVDLLSRKLTELIFDQKTGFTAIPKREKAVEPGQIKGRQQKGFLARIFTSTGNQKYYTDNQFVLKDRSDINRGVFSINLTRRTVIKVPYDTAGNLSGFYTAYKDDPQIFKVVNLADPAFQKREIFFRLDGDFAPAFEGLVNFVSVLLKKRYPTGEEATGELIFTREDVRKGNLSKSWRYARLGEKGASWMTYAYQVTWSLRGQRKLTSDWQETMDPIVTLAPPLRRLDLTIDADRLSFEESEVRAAVVQVRYRLFGHLYTQRLAVLKATDGESLSDYVLFIDPRSPIEYQVSWFYSDGQRLKQDWKTLEEGYLFLMPPE
ncbi:hypothetical protein G4V39_05550 [Thermosulfuriphilus ammonigenes]|uniref:Uncharacterized protein n=1 Tax=Thermosulfuriphilus ammonigenes TaxID=1936021 RepID=A0A6G7PVQ2_9BACT|nr:hypothetical protein [Thermosulfuriphilus ammonigenes]MBA2848052.1 hypothetical protein [Thermosulfuriphilus ammonigenes]QIJ71765.1 hypothetical protein G4V39_05550 [Thermosulfuriphilus ammonigenes]